MASDKLHTFGDANFESEVISSDVPVLVDFWAPWCGPCRMIAPLVEEAAVQYDGKAKVGKVNVDEAPMVAARYGIRSIPTILVFKNGQPVDQVIGAVNRHKLHQMLDQAI